MPPMVVSVFLVKVSKMLRGGLLTTEFYVDRLRLRSNPLTFLYAIFDRKSTRFVYVQLENGSLFTCLLTISILVILCSV